MTEPNENPSLPAVAERRLPGRLADLAESADAVIDDQDESYSPSVKSRLFGSKWSSNQLCKAAEVLRDGATKSALNGHEHGAEPFLLLGGEADNADRRDEPPPPGGGTSRRNAASRRRAGRAI
jgi:hypothetical protein